MRQSLQVLDRNITAERRESCIAAAPAVGQPLCPGMARAELWGAPAGAPHPAAGAAAAGMIASGTASSDGCAVLERAEEPAPKTEGQAAGQGDPPRRVCFVCTGNTCRSPMAAAVANAMAYEPLAKLPESLRELGRPELEAFSAGLAAGEGDPIADNAVRALEAAGVPAVPGQDYHRHTAHTLCGEEAERYDLLVAMSRQHALGLLLRFPQLAGRITTLGEDVPDPYGGSEQDYRVCLERITRLVRELLFPERKPAEGGA